MERNLIWGWRVSEGNLLYRFVASSVSQADRSRVFSVDSTSDRSNQKRKTKADRERVQ